jgi:hypothetical protein
MIRWLTVVIYNSNVSVHSDYFGGQVNGPAIFYDMDMLRLLTTPRDGWSPWSSNVINTVIHHLIRTHSSNDYLPQLKLLLSLCANRVSLLETCACIMTVEQCQAFLDTPLAVSSSPPATPANDTGMMTNVTNEKCYCPITMSSLATMLYRPELKEKNNRNVNQFKAVYGLLLDAATVQIIPDTITTINGNDGKEEEKPTLSRDLVATRRAVLSRPITKAAQIPGALGGYYHHNGYNYHNQHPSDLTLLVMAIKQLSNEYAIAIVSLLIQLGVDVNVQCQTRDYHYYGGDTDNDHKPHSPIWYACRLPKSDLTHLLLDAGALLSSPPVEILVATVHNHIDIVARMIQTFLTAAPPSWAKGGKGIAAVVCPAVDDDSKLEDEGLTQRTEPVSDNDSDSDDDEESGSNDDDDQKAAAKSATVSSVYVPSYRSNARGRRQRQYAEQQQIQEEARTVAQKYADVAANRQWIVPTDILLACILYGHTDMAVFWLSGARIIPSKYTQPPKPTDVPSLTRSGSTRLERKESLSLTTSSSSSSTVWPPIWLSKMDDIVFDPKLYFPVHICKRAIWRPLHQWLPLDDGVRSTHKQVQERRNEYRTKFASIRALAAFGWTIPPQSSTDSWIDRTSACIAAIVRLRSLFYMACIQIQLTES